MDFLELWKTYPVLWYHSPVQKDLYFKAALIELTNQINDKWNLVLTNSGMVTTFSRIRKWFKQHKKIEGKLHAKGKMTTEDFYEKNLWFGDKQNLQKYYEKCTQFLPTHETRTAFCVKCKCLFTDEQHLQEHAKRHKKYCDICKKDYSTTMAYRKHIAVRHQPPNFKCEICGKEYADKFRLREHIQAHREEHNFVCEKCGKKFVRKKNFQDHTKLRHPDSENYIKSQPCAICGIDFKNWSALCVHRRRHHMVLEGTIEELTADIRAEAVKFKKHTYCVDPVTQKRRLVCEECGNTYGRHSGLTRHMIKVHGFIPFHQRRKAAAQKTDSNISTVKQANLAGVDDKTKPSHNANQREGIDIEALETEYDCDGSGRYRKYIVDDDYDYSEEYDTDYFLDIINDLKT